MVVDTEGLRSHTATATSNSTLYSVTYDGNGNTGGAAPVDPLTYRQTKPVTVLHGNTRAYGLLVHELEHRHGRFGNGLRFWWHVSMGPGNVTLHAQWIQNGTVTIVFTINPTYGTITFSSPTVNVTRGNVLQLSPSLTGATNWHWYVNNVQDTTQTGSPFNWNTGGVQPGQYVINVDATYNGYPCTGSILATVGY